MIKSGFNKYINYTFYPLIAVLALFATFYGYINYTNKKAEKLYNSGLKIFFDVIKNKKDYQKRLEKAENIFKELSKYSMSKYYKLSMPFLGCIYFLKGDYDKALLFYSRFKEKIDSCIDYAFLSGLAISSCYEEEKKIDNALNILQKLYSEHPENPFMEFVLLNLERLYRLSNKPDKAKEISKKFVEQYPYSPFFYIAKAHLLSYNK